MSKKTDKNEGLTLDVVKRELSWFYNNSRQELGPKAIDYTMFVDKTEQKTDDLNLEHVARYNKIAGMLRRMTHVQSQVLRLSFTVPDRRDAISDSYAFKVVCAQQVYGRSKDGETIKNQVKMFENEYECAMTLMENFYNER